MTGYLKSNFIRLNFSSTISLDHISYNLTRPHIIQSHSTTYHPFIPHVDHVFSSTSLPHSSCAAVHHHVARVSVAYPSMPQWTNVICSRQVHSLPPLVSIRFNSVGWVFSLLQNFSFSVQKC